MFIPPYFIDRYLCVLRYVVELINEYEGTEGHDDNLGISTLRCLLDAKTPVGNWLVNVVQLPECPICMDPVVGVATKGGGEE